jgi:60 kDa SS-A/Ro ribonucleoprotein
MANKKLFTTKSVGPAASILVNTINNAGGVAYRMDAQQELAQLVFTGCFNSTYYVSAKDQMERALNLCKEIESDEFLAKIAVLGREQGFMKDTPAMILAVLTTRNIELVKLIWPRVINNVKMLRTFVQILRSGVTGRKSFGTAIKRLIINQLESMTPSNLFKNSIGNDPSLADIIKMVHPVGQKGNDLRGEMYAYIIGKECNLSKLPDVVQQFEQYKKSKDCPIPNLPFQFLDSLGLDNKGWEHIANTCSWQTLRMNLNTFERHGVWKNTKLVDDVAKRLADRKLILESNCFPYQLLMAYKFASFSPVKISNALQQAMEIATENIPTYEGQVYVCVDTSGSMRSPVTGKRGTATTSATCSDVAALFAASILRKNSNAEVIPFDTQVHSVRLNPMDSVMTNAQKLARNGGGTSCSVALNYLNRNKKKGDLVIFISDNESWFDSLPLPLTSGTEMAREWDDFKRNNPKAKLICIDITPNNTVQVSGSKNILNVGGFNDRVFNIIREFQIGRNWVDVINNVNLMEGVNKSVASDESEED